MTSASQSAGKPVAITSEADPKTETAALQSWLDRALTWRNRILAKPSFQRWAAAFPLTKPIAERNARALFDVCAGFVYSQVLLACIKLDLFSILADGPLTVADLSRRLGLEEHAARRLLNAAASLKLLDRRSDDRFGLGSLGAVLTGNPSIAAMIEHHALLYADLRDPIALLKGDVKKTELGTYWPYAGGAGAEARDPERVQTYTRLMAQSQPLISADILDAYSFKAHRCLLDVGGGDGTFLSVVLERAPHLALKLFDLPPVAAEARVRLDANGHGSRVEVHGGDFLADALPTGADVISLVRVIFDHDDATALRILTAVRRALPSDGVLLLAEPMSGTRGAEPISDAYFGFYLLAMGRGRTRTPEDMARLLDAAGFGVPQVVPTCRPMFMRLLKASPRR